MDIRDEPTEGSQAEAKLVPKVTAVPVDEEDENSGVLCKFHVCVDAKICAQRSAQQRQNAYRGTADNPRNKLDETSLGRAAQKSGEVEKDRVT